MNESKAITKAEAGQLAAIGEKRWDESSHSHVEITSELQMTYAVLHNQIYLGEAIRYDAMFKMRESHAYVVGNFSSFAEYAEAKWGLGRSQAYLCASRGERRLLLAAAEPTQAGNGENGKLITEALDKVDKKIRLAIYDMPQDMFTQRISDAWQSPDGQELSPEEVLKKIGGDLSIKNKSLKKQNEDLETDLQASVAEIAQLRKEIGGDATAIGERELKIAKLTEKIGKLEGERRKEAAFDEQLSQIQASLSTAWSTLLSYQPKDLDDYDAHGPEMDRACALATEYAGKFSRIVDRYHTVTAQREL